MPAKARSASFRLSSMNRMASVNSAFGQEMAHHAEEAMHAPDHVEEEKTGCGPMKNYPLLSVVCFAAVGLGIGIGLSFWEPDNADTKETTLKWIGLVGDLFIRALKCVILPLVFINVAISTVDMLSVGRAGSIGWKTVLLYLATTLIASFASLISLAIFSGLFKEGDFTVAPEAMVRLGCNDEMSYLTEGADGTVTCVMAEEPTEDSEFLIDDLGGTFVKSSGGISTDISLSDTVYDGVFTKLVTDNITGAFAEANFAAVVFFAIVFGVALGTVHLKRIDEGERNHVMPFFMELDKCFLTIINWIISITPFAVLSLITAAVGSQDDLVGVFENVGYLVIACIFGFIMQFFIVHLGLFYYITRWNPIEYLKHIIPAQTMAFACASSAATIPMTLKSVRSTGRVPESILKFVVPLGATVNMDGSAIYFPCACVWLAILNGITPNAAHYILLVVIATIGSAGTAPVPASGLVLIVTAYNTVFGTTGIPEGFSYVVAIDFFLDRCITVVNVTGDAVVCGMISKMCGIEGEEEAAEMTMEPVKELPGDDTNVKNSASASDESEEGMAEY